jgi:4'-phosphopantetheinyl transferase EntD
MAPMLWTGTRDTDRYSRSPMIHALLPATVVAVEAFDDTADAALFPTEEDVLGNSVERRRREFATGRRCARAALAGLGFPPAPILPGPHREPRWPEGIVGSITHCTGYRAAAVARAQAIASVGIDAEPNEPLPPDVFDEIALPVERTHLAARLAVDPGVRWDRLLFSAKESVYKTWFPLTGRWLDFQSADVLVESTGTFTARFLVEGPSLPDGTVITRLTGNWAVSEGLILTAIAVPVSAGTVPGRYGTTPRTSPATSPRPRP